MTKVFEPLACFVTFSLSKSLSKIKLIIFFHSMKNKMSDKRIENKLLSSSATPNSC